MTLANKLGAFSQEFASAKAIFVERGKATFNEAIKEFFDANPDVWCLAWSQYTPYFNDGEPCDFGVNEILAYTDAASETDLGELVNEAEDVGMLTPLYDVHSGWIAKDPKYVAEYSARNEKLKADFAKGSVETFTADFTALKEFVSANEELMEELYGDHVLVQIRRSGDGVESVTEEYEHD